MRRAAVPFPPFFSFLSFLALLGSLALAPAGAVAAVSAAPGWIAGTIALPAVNAADLTTAGGAIVVGVGSFGAGAQSIVRLERDGSATTLVTGLNALGGIAFDRENDRLLFTDNAIEAPPGTAVTGDTLYALPDPLGAVAPVAAATLELAPAGSIDFAQAVLPLPGGDVLVGDAAGFGGGRIVRYSGGVLTDLVTGLDFTAGLSLSLTPAGELLVGEVESTFFTGAVERYDLSGAFLGTLASGLSGAYDQETAASGDLLLTGGFTGDFSSGTVVAIAPGGAVSAIASGFGFSSGIAIDPQSQQAMVLDFGTSAVDTLTPVAALTPGGSGARDCNVELWGGAFDVARSGQPRSSWTCTDGAACDRDGAADGSCLFVVGTCFSVGDARLPACAPVGIDSALIRIGPSAAIELQAAADAILPTTAAACSAGTEITVAARKSLSIAVRARSGARTVDSDRVSLRCRAA